MLVLVYQIKTQKFGKILLKFFYSILFFNNMTLHCFLELECFALGPDKGVSDAQGLYTP